MYGTYHKMNLNTFNEAKFSSVIDNQMQSFVILDLSKNNSELSSIDISNAEQFSAYILKKIGTAHFGVGKYNEDRAIYNHSTLFGSERSIHLGMDLWTKPNTNVMAPLAGTVHSFANNKGKGDYGPTIILEHNLGFKFFTLYGHLTIDSLDISEGQEIAKGQVFAKVGNYPNNGDWPSHLHFQIITDMLGKKGDFAGVCSKQDRDTFLKLCPDPNIILRLGDNHGK